MDIRVLRYYLAICSEGNMSRAAEVLHVTQPTLSRQIADLERELGCTLFVRGSRNVTPTEKGIYLRRRAEEIIALADQTELDLKRDDSVVEGDVYIGAGESEGMRVIAAAIRRFQEQYPQVRFHVRSGNSVSVVEWLERGMVDFAVLMSYPNINRFEHMQLSPTDTWGVLVPDGHPLAKKEAVAPDDLLDVPLILSEQALETGELSQWFGSRKDGLDVRATYNLIFNAAQLVRERVGIAVAFDRLVSTGKGTGIEFRPLCPPVVSTINIAWKHDQVFTHAAKKFLEDLRKSQPLSPEKRP